MTARNAPTRTLPNMALPNMVSITGFARGLPGGGRAVVREGEVLPGDSPIVAAHPRAFVVVNATSAEISEAKRALHDAAAAATPEHRDVPSRRKKLADAVKWSGGPRRTAENDSGEPPRFFWTRKP